MARNFRQLHCDRKRRVCGVEVGKTGDEKQRGRPNNERKCTLAKMLLKKYVKTRRKLKILLLLAIVALLVITIIVLGSSGRNAAIELLLDERFIARAYRPGDQPQVAEKPPPVAVALLQPQRENGVIVPEKYDEQKIKERIIQSKIDLMKQQQQRDHEAEQSVSFQFSPRRWPILVLKS